MDPEEAGHDFRKINIKSREHAVQILLIRRVDLGCMDIYCSL